MIKNVGFKYYFNRLSRGFSLVELLIVITIIGVLSTIVLSSVSTSRARAYDSKIKQQLSSFRTAAEIYFTNQDPNSYGPDSVSCDQGMFNNMDPVNGTPAIYIASGNLPLNTEIACQSSGDSYAVKASLYSGNEYWCIDNTGVSRIENGTISGPSLNCP
jgi:prepilin-type N-terminal cleavage/methylation domain-containing protein